MGPAVIGADLILPSYGAAQTHYSGPSWTHSPVVTVETICIPKGNKSPAAAQPIFWCPWSCVLEHCLWSLRHVTRITASRCGTFWELFPLYLCICIQSQGERSSRWRLCLGLWVGWQTPRVPKVVFISREEKEKIISCSERKTST